MPWVWTTSLSCLSAAILFSLKQGTEFACKNKELENLIQKNFEGTTYDFISSSVIAAKQAYCKPTSVPGNWGTWSLFSGCSATCGKAARKRTRKCDDPVPMNGGQDCHGPGEETEDCNLKKCAEFERMEVNDLLVKKISQIKVDKKNLTAAEKVLNMNMVYHKESDEYAVSTGVAKDNLMDYADLLHTQLGITDTEYKENIRSYFKLMNVSVTHANKKEYFRFVDKDTLSTMFLFIAGTKNENDEYAFAYAFHHLEFKVAKKTVIGWFRNSKEDVTLNKKDIDAIKDNYCKYRTLLKLKNDGFIDEIQFS